MKHHHWLQALGGAAFLALVSTLGDFIWALWIPTHQTVYGISHGVILCLCIGLLLGFFAGSGKKIAQGALGSLVIGFAVSGGFYLIYPLLGMGAMFVCWAGLWVLTSLLFRQLRQSREPFWVSGSRGLLAALGSGLGFWPIYILWTKPPAGGPNYLVFFLAWTVAFLPGLLPLLMFRAPTAHQNP